MLELSSAALRAFGDDDSYVLGLHAFSLEENRRFDEGLAFAERAMAANPRDAWAVHAMAHVHYERGDNARGVEALPPKIHPCDHLGYFRNHLLWHLALMHLADGRYEHVRRMFESVFGGIPITVASDFQDSVSLAWRLDLFGHPDPTRWARLGAAARGWIELPLLLFHDVHVGMALAAAGDWHGGRVSSRARSRARQEDAQPDAARGGRAARRGAARLRRGRLRHARPSGSSRSRTGSWRWAAVTPSARCSTTRSSPPPSGRISEERATALLQKKLGKRANPGHYWTTSPIAGHGSARRTGRSARAGLR